MAKILLAAGIEIVSGAVTKIKTKSAHRYDENMFLFTHRKSETTSLACQRAYYRKVNALPWQNVHAITQDVQAQRLAFKTAARQVAARRQDLTKITADQEQFIAILPEVKSRGCVMTMKSFLWAAKKLYGEDFPTTAITMTAQQYISNSGSANGKDKF